MLEVKGEGSNGGLLTSSASRNELTTPSVFHDSTWLAPAPPAESRVKPLQKPKYEDAPMLNDLVLGGTQVGLSGKPSDLRSSILVVDDEQLNLDMLSRRLLRSGFTVEVAASGREALELVRRHSFDLILLDQMMPEVSGAEVLRILRADYSAEVLPIVMVTAVAESEKIAEALEAGANDYITKPVDYKVALARIRSQLARKQTEAALRQSEERYALVAAASQEGLWDWNLLTGFVYFSPRWKQMLGLEEHQVENSVDEGFSRIVAADRKTVIAAVQQHLQGITDVLQCSYRMLHADGSMRWMTCRGMVTRDLQGKAVRFAGSQSDVTHEKTHDVLTGMPNRLLLLGALELALARPRSSVGEEESHAVLFLDLDGFKQINDSLGHMAGDTLLRRIARRLQEFIAECDENRSSPLSPLAARMGGDEFAILLKQGATWESVHAFAINLQRAMNIPFEVEGHAVHCAFSIGVALASSAHSQPEDILRDADVAMYTAKRRGRGEIAVFDLQMQDAAVQRLDLENDIRLAVTRDELEVVYQPKVDLASGATYGVEALLRWNHPKRGLLQPGSFIVLAEETGAIVEIGRWILSKACIQVRAWHELFPMQPPLELSVNLSPREFKQQNLVEEIGRTLSTTGFPASCLHLEITEGVLFENMAAARSTLNALKGLGVSLDIDDFGTGYSSLKYLGELPFDLLKIDRYFIRSLDPEQPSSGELIHTILSMAQNIGLKVVAEGIETRQHSLALQELGCRFGQGYYFSRPINPQAIESLLASQGTIQIPEPFALPSFDAAILPGLPCQG